MTANFTGKPNLVSIHAAIIEKFEIWKTDGHQGWFNLVQWFDRRIFKCDTKWLKYLT